jgi:hypothetical protein
MEILTILQLLLAFFTISVAIVQSFQQIYWQWKKFQARRPRQPSGKVSHSYRNDPRNRGLQADLLVLLKNDVRTAKRLLLQQRRRQPGKTDNWYLEKVIYDLERDRR